MFHPFLNTLIVEPNNDLILPYRYLDQSYALNRFTSLKQAEIELSKLYPDIVFLSASYPPHKLIQFLEVLKRKSVSRLAPLIMVVDLSNQLNFIPGTTWAGKIGILNSISTETEFVVVIDRIYKLILYP